jgi:hypothetical protein
MKLDSKAIKVVENDLKMSSKQLNFGIGVPMFQKASGGKIKIGRKFLEAGKNLLKEVDLELQGAVTKSFGKDLNNEHNNHWDG